MDIFGLFDLSPFGLRLVIFDSSREQVKVLHQQDGDQRHFPSLPCFIQVQINRMVFRVEFPVEPLEQRISVGSAGHSPGRLRSWVFLRPFTQNLKHPCFDRGIQRGFVKPSNDVRVTLKQFLFNSGVEGFVLVFG